MLKTEIPIPRMFPVDLVPVVLEAFEAEAGPVAVEGVHNVLGTDALGLTLTEPYRERKIAGKVKDLKRYAGKAEDQPGILTGSVYEGINHQIEPGIGFSVGMADDAGIGSDGDDYGQALEERTEFLEKGVQSKEVQMKEILDAVIGRVIAEAGG